MFDRYKESYKTDLRAGFLVFLIALPLCLGIAIASNYPPISGILSAIVGGLLASFFGASRLTIKGPAAGLIVIALGAVQELGGGDAYLGYKRALAVGLLAAIVQIILALSKAGTLGTLMPKSVIHGMLAAIGIIIVSKQAHVMLGVFPHAKEPLELLAEISNSVIHANPEIALIGVLSLFLLFVYPLFKSPKILQQIPSSVIVLGIVIPLGTYFHLSQSHTYTVMNHQYLVSSKFLVQLPGQLLSAITLPDFSQIWTWVSMKYVVMFALVGSIESLLTVTAIDGLDPEKRTSDLNRDLLIVGIGNVVSALIGGLPMISEIVRSKANIDQGSKTELANFFHGAFLLLFVALLPGVLKMIPLAALAAMLVYTGLRLASPHEFIHTYKIGKDQFLYFMTTLFVTLATDLLIGVAVGLALKVIVHLFRGAPLKSLFKLEYSQEEQDDEIAIQLSGTALFFNWLSLSTLLKKLPDDKRDIVIDVTSVHLIDHSFLEKLGQIDHEWGEKRNLVIKGLDDLKPYSEHPKAARRAKNLGSARTTKKES